MMKKYYYNILASLLLLMTAACSVDDYGDSTAFGRKGTRIRLTAGTAASDQMRAATDIQSTLFDAGERLNVYIWSGDVNSSPIWIGNPTLCTTKAESGGKNELTPDEGMEPSFPQDGSTVSLYGLYPITATHSSTDFTVLEDQKSDGNYKLSDLMWGGKYVADPQSYSYYTDLTATTEPIDLFFTHKMAKLIVKVTSEGAGNVKNVALKGVKRAIGFTPLTGELGDDGTLDNTGDIVLTETGNISENGSACLLPPQSILGEFLEIETDKEPGSTAVIAIANPKTFESGHVYTLNIAISELNLAQRVTIPEWGNVSTLNVEAFDATSFQIEDIPNQTYTGNAVEPSITVTMEGEVVDPSKYEKHYYNNVAQGYAVVVVQGLGDLEAKNAARTFYIQAAASVITTPPDGLGSSPYDGNAHPLCSAGAAIIENTETPATISYSLNKTGPYTSTIPQTAEPGTYYVWYKIEPTENYGGVAPQMVENPTIITLAALSAEPQVPVAKDLTYNEKPQLLVEPGRTTEGRIVYCLTQDGIYTADVPSGTNAGTYHVWWKVDGQGKYQDTEPACVDVVINKAEGRITTNPEESLRFELIERVNTTKNITIERAGTGAITTTLISGEENISITPNADGDIVYATRLHIKDGTSVLRIKVEADQNYLEVTRDYTVTLDDCETTLDKIKVTDSRFLGYVVGTDGKIYPPSVTGHDFMVENGQRPAGIITYIGSDARALNGAGSGGHGYILAIDNEHKPSNSAEDGEVDNTTYMNYAPWVAQRFGTHDMEYTSGVNKKRLGLTIPGHAWKLGSKDDYDKAYMSNWYNVVWYFSRVSTYWPEAPVHNNFLWFHWTTTVDPNNSKNNIVWRAGEFNSYHHTKPKINLDLLTPTVLSITSF